MLHTSVLLWAAQQAPGLLWLCVSSIASSTATGRLGGENGRQPLKMCPAEAGAPSAKPVSAPQEWQAPAASSPRCAGARQSKASPGAYWTCRRPRSKRQAAGGALPASHPWGTATSAGPRGQQQLDGRDPSPLSAGYPGLGLGNGARRRAARPQTASACRPSWTPSPAAPGGQQQLRS